MLFSLNCNSPSLSKNAFDPSSLNNETLQCIPEPLIPAIGFGMNVAYNPCLRAIDLTTNLNV